jgi:hypothetical protein
LSKGKIKATNQREKKEDYCRENSFFYHK